MTTANAVGNAGDVAVDRADRYIELGNLVGNGSLAMDIGENDYARTGFRAILEAGAADVWMLDLARVGGISELRKVAELAAAHDVPVSNHVYAEHSIGALATLPNCRIAEYIDWFEPLLEQRLELRDGAIVVPDRPGLGFTFDEAAIARLRTLA